MDGKREAKLSPQRCEAWGIWGLEAKGKLCTNARFSGLWLVKPCSRQDENRSYKAASLWFQVCEVQIEISGFENWALGETHNLACVEEVVAEAQLSTACVGENPDPLNITKECKSWWELGPPAPDLVRQRGVIDGTCSAAAVLCGGLLSCQLCLPEALLDMLV